MMLNLKFIPKTTVATLPSDTVNAVSISDGVLQQVARAPMQTTRGTQLARKLDVFLEYWDSHAASMLEPVAFLRASSFDNLDPALLPMLDGMQCGKLGDTGDAMLVCAIWSIGEQLEHQVQRFFDEGSALQALFLDTAGSRMLLALHRIVRDWVQHQSGLCGKALNLVEERYPGANCMASPDVGSLVEFCQCEPLVRSVMDGTLFVPLKTMYSLFIAGPGEPNLLDFGEQCPDCRGRACLYWQMGGCHVAFSV